MDPLEPPPRVRNPDTVFLFGLCLFAGIGQLAAGTEPGTVAALAPVWLSVGWGLILVTGAILTLAGVFAPRPGKGELIELVGRAMFGPAALAYGFAIAVAAGAAGITEAALAAAPFLGFAFSCLWRAVQIIRHTEDTLRRLRRRTRERT